MIIKFHFPDKIYEFMDKKSKLQIGIIREIDIRVTFLTTSIIYVVEYNGYFFNVDHETNRVL